MTEQKQQQEQQGLFEYPYSLAFGIIVGYFLALVVAVIIAAVRRKNCCPIVGVENNCGGGGCVRRRGLLTRLERGAAGASVDDASELAPLTAVAREDGGCTAELAKDSPPSPHPQPMSSMPPVSSASSMPPSPPVSSVSPMPPNSTVVLVDTPELVAPTELPVQESIDQPDSLQEAGSDRDEVETDDESRRLRRLTEQLDAILDEFSAEDMSPAADGEDGGDHEDPDRRVAALAAEIVSRAVRQAIQVCHGGE